MQAGEGRFGRWFGRGKCFMCARLARRTTLQRRIPHGLDYEVDVCRHCADKLQLAQAYLRAMKGS